MATARFIRDVSGEANGEAPATWTPGAFLFGLDPPYGTSETVVVCVGHDLRGVPVYGIYAGDGKTTLLNRRRKEIEGHKEALALFGYKIEGASHG